jgi:mRNA interferase HigB
MIATKTIKAFYRAVPAAQVPMSVWIEMVKQVRSNHPLQIKQYFGSADLLQDGRVVFDLGGNKFRIVAKVNYRRGIVYIRFVGTHAGYGKIDANRI